MTSYSIKLFESIGFIKVGESPNYFGEFELIFEGFLRREQTMFLLEKYIIEGYSEVVYSRKEQSPQDKAIWQ